MADDLYDAIPADRREVVRSALADAFGPAPLTGLEPVFGGASGALVYWAEVADRPYLLRLETKRDLFRDPRRGFACMRAAADAGVAPALHHADPAAGVAIMDFVPQRPLTDFPGGPAAVARALGELVGRLQTTPAFPPLADYPVLLNGMFGYLRGSGLFAPGLLDPHAEGFERLREAYPWDSSALVSSHNDANPRNILYDGERLWLIDWELSFRNDPLVDVAILADEFAQTPDLEAELLQAWFGRAPDSALRARLTLMRQFTRLFYACIMLSMSIGNHAQETDLAAPSIAEFREAVAQGRLRAATPEILHSLGKMVLAGFLAGFSAPGFEEALSIARRG
ncbi:MAG: phosphotransferase [Caulobacteraceae bacterium]